MLIAAKTLLCAALVWFLLLQPGAAIEKALVYALVAWAIALGVVSCFYFAVSVDDSRDVLLAAVTTSSAAMWLVPAVLLLSMRIAAADLLGLILIANSMRLLFSGTAPRARSLAELRLRRHGRRGMFSQAEPPPTFAREILPVIAGTVLLQMGAAAAWLAYPGAAAGLMAVGAAALTRILVARGSYRRRGKRNTRMSLLSIVLTLLLSVALSGGPAGADSEPASMAGLAATTSRIARGLTRRKDLKQADAKPTLASLVRPVPKPKKFTTNANQVPGVILQPEKEPERKRIALQLFGKGIAPAGILSFPFTGEYHLFPSSSGGVQRDSVVHRGTPLDFLYASASGGAVETEAYQPLDPPYDFSACAKILLKIKSGEVTPSSASMQLEVAGQLVDAGIGIFGLERATEETLEFELPALRAGLSARGIRVIFRRDPAGSDQTTKVAIQRFTLVPR